MRVIILVATLTMLAVGFAEAQPPTPQEQIYGLRKGIGQLQEANGRLQQANVEQEQMLTEILAVLPTCKPTPQRTIASCVAELRDELAKLKTPPAASPAAPAPPGAPAK